MLSVPPSPSDTMLFLYSVASGYKYGLRQHRVTFQRAIFETKQRVTVKLMLTSIQETAPPRAESWSIIHSLWWNFLPAKRRRKIIWTTNLVHGGFLCFISVLGGKTPLLSGENSMAKLLQFAIPSSISADMDIIIWCGLKKSNRVKKCSMKKTLLNSHCYDYKNDPNNYWWFFSFTPKRIDPTYLL